MQARLTLADVGIGGVVEGDLSATTGGEGDLAAVTVAVGGGADETEVEPAAGGAGGGVVAVKESVAAGLSDKEVLAAVVVGVEDHDAAAETGVGDAESGGAVGKRAVALVDEETRGVGAAGGEIGTGADVTVGHGEIGPAVVVGVEQADAPTPAGLLHPGAEREFGEAAVAGVAEELVVGDVALVGGGRRIGETDGGDEEIEFAVAVVVKDGESHAVGGVGDTTGIGAVGESAIAVVPPELAGAEIAG